MDRHTHIWGRDGIYHWRAFGLHTELSRKCSSTMPSDNRSKKIEQGRRVEQRKRRQKESIVGCVCVGSLESEGFWFGGFLFALVARRKKKEKRKKKKKELVWNFLIPWGGTVLRVLSLSPIAWFSFLLVCVAIYVEYPISPFVCVVWSSDSLGFIGPGFHLFNFMSWGLGEVKRVST